MVPPEFSWSFRGVFVGTNSLVLFVAGHDDSTNKRIPVSYAFLWDGQWKTVKVPFVATGIVAVSRPKPIVYVMGVGGWVQRWEGEVITDERIDDTDDGPQNYGDLTEIRNIDDHVYIVGMSRTVYRSDGCSEWIRIDQGVRCSEDDASDAGFTSIDGFSQSDIYAVGWDGEIWHYNGSKWLQLDSPTNSILFRVICGKDGNVYACGQNGILLRGKGVRWKVIEQDTVRENFWGATWFKGSLYLSTKKGIYRLEDDRLENVITQSDSTLQFAKGTSFYRLDSNNDEMWSAGIKMVISTTDGIRWVESSYP